MKLHCGLNEEKFRSSNLICFTETWLNENHSADIEGECFNRILINLADQPVFILGDFKTLALIETPSKLQQYIDCATHFSSTLDLCYGNIEDTYKAVCRASLVNWIIMLSIYLQKTDDVCNTSPPRQVTGEPKVQFYLSPTDINKKNKQRFGLAWQGMA